MIDHFRFDKGGISRKPSRYYLAYGSNLDMERMGHRCPYAVPVGVTEIYGYRLLFKKSKTGATPPSSRMPMKASQLWYGCFPSLMNCCWIGMRAALGTITRSSSSFPSGIWMGIG